MKLAALSLFLITTGRRQSGSHPNTTRRSATRAGVALHAAAQPLAKCGRRVARPVRTGRAIPNHFNAINEFFESIRMMRE